MLRLIRFLLLALCVTSLARAQAQFQHPGILPSLPQLERIRDGVAGGLQPWTGAYEAFRAQPTAKSSYTILGPRSEVGRNPDVNRTPFESDSVAAFQNAVQWFVTGEQAYADKSQQILNAWANGLTTISGKDARLMAGVNGWKFAAAGEILRRSPGMSSGWAPAQISALEQMLLTVIYPVVSQNGDANWGTCETYTAMAIAIFCERRDIYDEALANHRSHPGSSVARYILPSGQVGESGRDQAHTQGGIGHLALAAEAAWAQGDNLWMDLDGGDRLRAGFDYTARYGLGQDVPFYTFGTVNATYSSISSVYRGRLISAYELVHNHYVRRLGVGAPWVEAQVRRLRPEVAGNDHPGVGSLLHAEADAWPEDYMVHGLYRILAVATGKALGVVSNGTSIGTRIEARSYSGVDSQHWRVVPLGGGYHLLSNALSSGLVIDSTSTPSAATRNPALASHAGQTTAHWLLEPYAGGHRVVAKDSLFADLPLTPIAWSIPAGASAAEGALLTLAVSANDSSQVFSLEAVNSPAVPFAPVGVQAVGRDGRVELSWRPVRASAATTYTVSRAISASGPFSPLPGGTALSSTTFSDSTVVNGTTYHYTVHAVVSGIQGAPSTSVRARPVAVPDAPLDLTVSQGETSRHAVLAWSSVPGAEEYAVSRATALAGPFVRIARGVTATRFVDQGCRGGVAMHYRVAAINRGGESASGATASVTTQLVPLGESREIGAPNMLGASRSLGGGSWSVAGAGGGTATSSPATYEIGGTYDACHFRYQVMSGDGELVARVVSFSGIDVDKGVQTPDPLAKAGLMVRESLDPSARQVFVGLTAGGSAVYTARAGTGGTATTSTTSGKAAPYWLRLTRAGSTLTGYISPDGASWSSLGSTNLALGNAAYVGLAVCSRQTKVLVTSVVDSVTVPAPAMPPESPTGLTAVSGNAQVTLSWTAVPGATGYAIKRSRSSNGDSYAVVGSTAGTSFSNTSLTNGTLYYFAVSATGPAGESPNSATVASTPLPPPPVAPSGLAATAGYQLITLSWSAVNGASSYVLRRSPTSGGPYSVIASGVTGATYTDTGIANDTPFYYVVSSVGLGGEGAPSAEVLSSGVSQAPPSPAGLSLLAGNGFVELTWSPSVGATSYLVRRAVQGVGAMLPIVAGVAGGRFVDSTAENGVAYVYDVTAINGAGSSAASSSAAATPVASQTVVIPSIAVQDGFVTAADSTNSAGGSINASATTARTGDSSTDLQYRSVLSFDSSLLPDDAAVTSATLSLRRASVTGTPAVDLGPLSGDIKGFTGFSFATSLVTADFAALADSTGVLTLVDPGADGAFANAALSAASLAFVDPVGTTQLRLAHVAASDADGISDSHAWSTSNDADEARRPTLSVTYTVPDPGLTKHLEAESYTALSGIQFQTTNDVGGGLNTSFASNNDWLRFDGVDFGAGTTLIRARVAIQASGPSGSRLEFRLNGAAGTLIASMPIPVTGGWGTWATRCVPLAAAVSGRQNLVVLFKGSTSPSALINLNWIQLGIPTPPPGIPLGLVASGGDAQVSLSWTPVSGATLYEVRRRSAGGASVVIGSPTAASWSDAGLASGATYSYTVTAVNAGGASAESAVVSATTFSALELWRIAWFASPSASGPGADGNDADGDGLSNLDEFLSGTVPTNAASVLRIADVALSASDVLVSFDSNAGVTYRVVRRDDLLAGSWVVVAEGIAGTGDRLVVVDPEALTTGLRRYYRIETQ